MVYSPYLLLPTFPIMQFNYQLIVVQWDLALALSLPKKSNAAALSSVSLSSFLISSPLQSAQTDQLRKLRLYCLQHHWACHVIQYISYNIPDHVSVQLHHIASLHLVCCLHYFYVKFLINDTCCWKMISKKTSSCSFIFRS